MAEDKASLKELEKNKRIKKEYQKLKKLFKNTDKNQVIIIDNLIENVAFMSITLKDLQQAINEKGFTENYKHGENQHGIKKIPEIDIYNVMIKNYNQTVKQLREIALAEAENGADELLDFIQNR